MLQVYCCFRVLQRAASPLLSWFQLMGLQRVEGMLASAVDADPNSAELSLFVALHIASHRENDNVEKLYLTAATLVSTIGF